MNRLDRHKGRALHLDRLGSAHRQTDSAGALAASVQRDAFGGALAGGFGTWRGPFAFAGAWGYEEDGDTGRSSSRPSFSP